MRITEELLRQIIREELIKEIELHERKKGAPPPGNLWNNIRKRRAAGKRPKRPGEAGYPKTLDID